MRQNADRYARQLLTCQSYWFLIYKLAINIVAPGVWLELTKVCKLVSALSSIVEHPRGISYYFNRVLSPFLKTTVGKHRVSLFFLVKKKVLWMGSIICQFQVLKIMSRRLDMLARLPPIRNTPVLIAESILMLIYKSCLSFLQYLP